jgi:hypothetical protein
MPATLGLIFSKVVCGTLPTSHSYALFTGYLSGERCAGAPGATGDLFTCVTLQNRLQIVGLRLQEGCDHAL